MPRLSTKRASRKPKRAAGRRPARFRGRAPASVDPQLREQLAQAGESHVEAVFRLRPDTRTSARAAPAGRTTARVGALLARMEGKLAESPSAVNVFRNLGYFVVSASPRFIRALAEQPEVASAQANRRSEPAGS